jgi:hypothetical protein
MKSLFDRATAEELRQRMGQLRPESEHVWGRMNAAQMLAHCSVGMEVSLGDLVLKQILLGRIFGKRVKASLLGGKPMGHNAPTDKHYVVAGERDFEVERQRLAGLIERFQAGGPGGCTKHPHSFFGRMTPDEWSALNYVHLDHHLKQFGV